MVADRAQEAAEAARPYAERLEAVVSSIASKVEKGPQVILAFFSGFRIEIISGGTGGVDGLLPFLEIGDRLVDFLIRRGIGKKMAVVDAFDGKYICRDGVVVSYKTGVIKIIGDELRSGVVRVLDEFQVMFILGMKLMT